MGFDTLDLGRPSLGVHLDLCGTGFQPVETRFAVLRLQTGATLLVMHPVAGD